jgi:DNA-binding MarR family transcriptional regulator
VQGQSVYASEVGKAASSGESVGEAKQVYLETLSLIERLHRRFLDVVKAELDHLGLQDVNNVQSLILYNIGDDVLTVGELTNRGYYLGSNVSYNVKKLVENGYLEQQRSPHDRRSVRVRLSAKALELCERINALHDRHVQAMFAEIADAGEFDSVNTSLRALERFWTDQLRFSP